LNILHMSIRTPTDLAALVRARRRALGIDQRTLATRIGVSREWVIRLEGGRAVSTLLAFRALDALGIQLVAPAPGARSTRRVVVPDIDAVVRNARKKPRGNR
jgi:ribosome-binding protein aMBF1 (putative translation factor)